MAFSVWKWKLQGEMDFKILEKLEARGLKVSKQFLSAMWRKPFYCGINTHKFLKGNPIKGNWEAMVSVKDFKKINQMLNEKTNHGYKQTKYHEGRPLQFHLRCGNCGEKLTGYKAKKQYDYYKCLNKDCNAKDMNAFTSTKSIGVNELFEEYLSQFNLDESLTEAFKAQMKLTINQLEYDSLDNRLLVEKKIKDVKMKMEQLERNNAFNGMEQEYYLKFKAELTQQISSLNDEKAKMGQSISNLDSKIESCTNIIKDISKTWSSGSLNVQNKIQKLVFPEGLVIDPKNREYRTTKVNSVFLKSAAMKGDVAGENEKRHLISQLPSSLVAGARLERTTFGL